MPSRYSSYDDYDYDNSYADARNSRRQSRTQVKVKDVAPDRIAAIRQRELAAFYGEPEKSLVLRRDDSPESFANDDVASSRQLVRTQRSTDDAAVSQRNDDHYRRSSRRDSTPTNYDRRGGRRRARAQSEGGYKQQTQQDRQLQRAQTLGQDQDQSNGQTASEDRERRIKISMNKDKIEQGQLHYSLREKKDGSFLQRNFDSSWDGVIAAGAGAAFGAVTARRLRPIYVTDEEQEAAQKQNRLKMLGAAAVGAAAFNAGENWFRVWAEQNAERSEAVATAMEGCCEGLDNFPIA